jgi:hypothetical protein
MFSGEKFCRVSLFVSTELQDVDVDQIHQDLAERLEESLREYDIEAKAQVSLQEPSEMMAQILA